MEMIFQRIYHDSTRTGRFRAYHSYLLRKSYTSSRCANSYDFNEQPATLLREQAINHVINGINYNLNGRWLGLYSTSDLSLGINDRRG